MNLDVVWSRTLRMAEVRKGTDSFYETQRKALRQESSRYKFCEPSGYCIAQDFYGE